MKTRLKYARLVETAGRGFTIGSMFLVGSVLSSAWADAPVSVSGMVYQESTHSTGASDLYVTVAVLRADGTFTTIIQESFFWLTNFGDQFTRTVGETVGGTYLYEKTGVNTATLTFSTAVGNGITSRNLEFSSPDAGGFQFSPPGSGAFVYGGGSFVLSSVSAAPIVNSAARGTATASKPLILGFCVPQGRASYVLVRAVGPGLTQFDVQDAAQDTTIEIDGRPLINPRGEAVRFENDDWEVTPLHALSPGASPLATTVGAFMGAFPLEPGSKDAAIVLQFPPGAYTAVIRTKSEMPAEVLGEIYIVP